MSDALAPVPAPDLSHLYDVADEARAYAAHARAPATRRAYASDWRAFAGWCQQQAVSALPAPPAAVALYLTETARRCKVATHWRESAAEHGQLDTRKGRRGDIMELISILLALGGLLLAAFSQWLAFRSRTSFYQERVYQTQADLYQELIEAVYPLHILLRARLSGHTAESDPDETEAMLLAFIKAQTKATAYAPNFVLDAAVAYGNLCTETLALLRGISMPAQAQYAEKAQAESLAFLNVLGAIRDAMGIASLSRNTMKLIGSAPYWHHFDPSYQEQVPPPSPTEYDETHS